MKKLSIYTLIGILICSCANNKNESVDEYETMVVLHSDTLNIIKLTDSLIIHEHACRGCAYEESTHFDISDSTGIMQLAKVITTDNNPADMDGGSINKDLILVPAKKGVTKIKLYKFIDERPTAKDSALFTTYTIEVRN